MGRTGKLFLTICVIAAAGLLCVYGLKNFGMKGGGGRPSHLDQMVEKLQSLPADYSLEQALKDGLVNSSGVQTKKNEIVDRFFQQVEQGESVDLVTAEADGDDVLIKFYYYDADLDLIRSWKYRVKEQVLKDPDKRLNKECRTKKEGDATVIYLEGASDGAEAGDEVLYRYFGG